MSIAGRVVRRAKAPGTFFTEQDFFPVGTSSGLSAAVPAGQVAYTVDASKLNGVAGLGLGDRFDLIATRPVDFQKMAQRIGAKDLAVSSAIRQGGLRLDAGAHTQVVLRGATVIAPPGSSAMQMHGAVNGSTQQDVQSPMVIAVSPDEISKLSEVLAVETRLTAILRGNRNENDVEPIFDSADPTESVHVLDSMIRSDHQPIVFLGDRKSSPTKPLNLGDLLPLEDGGNANDKGGE